jgi:hypothetical protein
MSGLDVRRDKAALSNRCKSQEQPARLQTWEVGDLCGHMAYSDG